MKHFLMILFCVAVLLGVHGVASSEERQSSLRPPRFEEPKPGRTLDTSFRVALDGISPGAACVSVMADRARILLPRDILERLRAARPEQARTEEENMAVLHGNRAQTLLESVTEAKDDFGCATAQAPFDGDAGYLIGELLKSGQAGVVMNSTNRQVDHIFVRYKAKVSGPLVGKGDISFSFSERSTPFFIVLWWIS